jgi:SAM-dependent methyltransferase
MYYDMFVIAYLFFINLNDLLIHDSELKILDIGSYDVNGNLRDVISLSNFRNVSYNYTGIDMSEGPNVDVVVGPEHTSWPFQPEEFDIVTSVSALEHDSFFWETFTEMVSLLKDGGLLYLNVPAEIPIHRFPVDNWRFFPDAAGVLKAWAAKQNQHVDIIHSSSIDLTTLMIFRKRSFPVLNDATSSFIQQLHDHFVPMQRDGMDNIQLINSFLLNKEVAPEAVLRANHVGLPGYRHFPLPYQLLRDIPSKYTIDSKCRVPHKHQLTQPASHLNEAHYLVPLTINIPTDNMSRNTCSFDAKFVLIERDMLSESQLESSIVAMMDALFIEEKTYITVIKDWVLANRQLYKFQ